MLSLRSLAPAATRRAMITAALLAAGLVSGPAAVAGPVAAAAFGAQVTLPFSGLNGPGHIAVDQVGNVYVADNNNDRVVELTTSGAQVTLPFGGLPGGASGVAVDPAGDVFATSFGSPGGCGGAILEFTATGSLRNVPSGCQEGSLSVDQDGDVFTIQSCPSCQHAVVEVPRLPAGGWGTPVTLAGGGVVDQATAVDAAGDVYWGDGPAVYELPAGQSQPVTLPLASIGAVTGIAVDDAGDVFVADAVNSDVVELTPAGSQSTLPFTGLNQPYGIVVNARGVFVADNGNNRVVELPFQPACTPGTAANFRWHYSASGGSGSWSGTQGASCPGVLSMGPQAMEGDLKVTPGSTLQVGYDLTIPGNHAPSTLTIASPQVTFTARCASGATPSAAAFTVTMPTTTYTITSDAWYPSGDQSSPLVYQGSASVPDLCGGGLLRLDKGGTFTATLS